MYSGYIKEDVTNNDCRIQGKFLKKKQTSDSDNGKYNSIQRKQLMQTHKGIQELNLFKGTTKS